MQRDRSLINDLHSLGGIARRQQLAHMGHHRGVLTRAVAAGRLVALRRPWVASPAIAPSFDRHALGAAFAAARAGRTGSSNRSDETSTGAALAVQSGGVLDAGAALRALGVWTVEELPLHIRCAETGSRLPPLDGLPVPLVRSTARIRFPVVDPATPAWRVGAREAVCTTWRRREPMSVLVVLDSVLRHRVLRAPDLVAIAAEVQEERRPLLDFVTGVADAGGETLLARVLRLRGHEVRQQAAITTGAFGDLLVDGRLLVEVDGVEHHLRRFRNDQARDRSSALLGLPTHRIRSPGSEAEARQEVDAIESLLTVLAHPAGPLLLPTAARRRF